MPRTINGIIVTHVSAGEAPRRHGVDASLSGAALTLGNTATCTAVVVVLRTAVAEAEVLCRVRPTVTVAGGSGGRGVASD